MAHIDGIGMSKMPGKWREIILAEAAAIRASTEGGWVNEKAPPDETDGAS